MRQRDETVADRQPDAEHRAQREYPVHDGDAPRVGPRGGNQGVACGFGVHQPPPSHAVVQEQRQRQDHDAEPAVPLHPGAGEQEGAGLVFHRRRGAEPRGGDAGDCFEPAVEPAVAGRAEGIAHHQRADNKHPHYHRQRLVHLQAFGGLHARQRQGQRQQRDQHRPMAPGHLELAKQHGDRERHAVQRREHDA